MEWLFNLLNSEDQKQRAVGIAAAAFASEARSALPELQANVWAARQLFNTAAERASPSDDVTEAMMAVNDFHQDVEPASMYIGE